MKHITIGIAGHVDHGKTRLTMALTGKNTDRLEEEQRRGITIETGFAKLTLPNGWTAGIVDVPGHERFIRNMIVGASGVDVVLMTVAADEGFMPQTQEHMDILGLLGVKNGIIVLTKTDIVDDDWLLAITEDTRERVKGTFLEKAPIVPVSAQTGQGIDALMGEIVKLAERAEERTKDRPFRLPVDRAFSLSGYGVIATGTLVDGSIHAGDAVMLYPQEKPVRVRELQNHDVSMDCVQAGMRAAVNLTGVDKTELARGCVIAQPGSMRLSDGITAKLTLLAGSPYTVKNSSQVHFYHGTRELVARVRLLDRDELKEGGSCFAQLALNEPLAARCMDRFIIRFFSPVTTIGGGTIIDMKRGRLKRNDASVLERLERLAGHPVERILQMTADAGLSLITRDELYMTSGLTASDVDGAIRMLVSDGSIIRINSGLAEKCVLDSGWERVKQTLEAFHTANPLLGGIPLGELRERAFAVPQKQADDVLSWFASQGRLRIEGPTAALADFDGGMNEQQRRIMEELSALYRGYGLMPPANDEAAAGFASRDKLYRQVFRRMCDGGELVALTPQYTVHGECFEAARAAFTGMFDAQKRVTLAEFRTKMGISRKYAQMYLECFDSRRISKLIGDSRVLLSPVNKA